MSKTSELLGGIDARFTAYVESVLTTPGDYPVLISAVIKRHEEDLKRSEKETPDFPFYFDQVRAGKVVSFIEKLRQTKDLWMGVSISLEPWQVFFIGSVFGWRNRETGFRRFKTALLAVPKKNGKTTLISAIALYFLRFGSGSEIYCASNDRDQAGITYRQSRDFVRITPGLQNKIIAGERSLRNPELFGKMETVHADPDRLNGKNSSVICHDELFDSTSPDMFIALKTGQASRKEPIYFMFGSHTPNINGFFYKWEREEAIKKIQGKMKDETFFGMIWEPDPDDDLNDVKTWKKVNPNWGASIDEAGLRSSWESMKNSSILRIQFYNFHLNLWTNSASLWIPQEKLEAVKKKSEKYAGLPALIAYDLSIYHDLTAFAYLIPGEIPSVFLKFYIPQDSLEKRLKIENPLYLDWVENGHISLCPGESITHDFLFSEMKKTILEKEIQEIADISFDPRLSVLFNKELEEAGMNASEFPQYNLNMSPAIQELERAISEGKIFIEDNPVLDWCFSNAEVRTSPKGLNYITKPDKARNRKRIDGVVALIMVYWRFLTLFEGDKLKPNGNFYQFTPVGFI